MVKYSAQSLNSVFSALADPTRRAILQRLSRGESSVTDLARPFDVSLPAISKHLRVLEKAGLLARRKDGRVFRCRLVARPLRDAAAWIARYHAFWEKQFDALAGYLRESGKKEERR
ncbi:MAG: ArsR/SmtB family transcription factor [Candidatus Methylomirabilales bacterium]